MQIGKALMPSTELDGGDAEAEPDVQAAVDSPVILPHANRAARRAASRKK
jgi:hypothetical protein